jgi:hypothetical protein
MIRVNSFGGGIQSVAALVLQAQGRISYDAFVFSNVGADSENPDTLTYYEQYAKPFAEAHGIPLVEVGKLRFEEPDTLYQTLMRDDRSIHIPAYMATGAPGQRSCTHKFKIEVVARWIRLQGHREATVGLNISTDEIERAHTPQWQDISGIKEIVEYPLIDLRISRNDCRKLITEAGLPVPPKSACYFCPFHSRHNWVMLKTEHPELFQKAVEIERFLNYKREKIGKDQVYLHPNLVPLDQAVGDQSNFFGIVDNCESGYCMV